MNDDNTQGGAEPSPASGGSVAHPLEQIIRGTVRLHELIEQGRCDSDEADAVRDEMDVPFLELSESEREAARLVSAAIKDREWIPVTERLPEEGEWCWVTDSKVAWISCHETRAAGGWTNGDCWEDFSKEVVAWFPVGGHPPLPAPPASA